MNTILASNAVKRVATVVAVCGAAVFAIAAAAYFVLGLPLGACVLLGGILAPTDPVLAAGTAASPSRMRRRSSSEGEPVMASPWSFSKAAIALRVSSLNLPLTDPLG